MLRVTRSWRLALPLLLLLTTPSLAADAPPAPVEVTSVEGITEYRLHNGLQVLLFPDQTRDTFTVNVTYLVGSRHEGRGEAGMAHLLEHMVFKGTPSYENIWGALEDHGANFNGSTWVDRTNYYETLQASDKNLEFALHMEADRMVNSLIDADVLAKEMTVVRNEFEMGENYPKWKLSERMMSAAYLWHNYGKSTIGNRSDLERVPAANLKRFYERYYQPDNAVLVVAGKFDPAKTLKLIQKHFGAIPRPERTLDATWTEEPTQDGPRFVTLERVGDVAACGLIYHVPAGAHPDFPAVQVLEDVLTAEPSGRLYKALVESGMATSVGGSAYAWAEPGVLELLAEVRADGDPQATLDKMIDVVEGLAAAEITAEEVERSKTRLLKNIKLALSNSQMIGVWLSEWAALGDWRMLFIHRDRIKEIGVEDVQQAASSYLLASNRTAGLYVPTSEPLRAEIPATPDVALIAQDYTGSEEIQQGEDFETSPENIERRTERLSPRDGMQLALLEKKTRGQSVRASFRFHFGSEQALEGRTTVAEFLPELLSRGTQSKDYQQLRDEIDRLQSRIGISGGAGMLTASIQSDRDNIVPAINLLVEMLRQPSFPADQFEIMQKERLAQAEEGLSDPQARGFNALNRAMNPWPTDSIHYVPTLEEGLERIEQVELAQVKGLYKELVGASHMQAAVVGDFDRDALLAALEQGFGDWSSPAEYTRISKPYRPVDADSLVIETPDKQMAVVGAGALLPMRDDNPDYPAIEFASYVLGQSAKSRLLERLRQQEGLSYGAGAFFQADEYDERAGLLGFAICAPQNAVKAQDAMREEIQRWVKEGLTAEELEEGKVSLGLKWRNNLSNDGYVSSQLAQGLELDRTFAYQAKRMERIQALTLEQVDKTLDKHFAKRPFVEMRAGDFQALPKAEAEAAAVN